MASSSLLAVLFSFCLLWLHAQTREDPGLLSMDEELRVGTLVGNLYDVLRRQLSAAGVASTRDAQFRLSIPDAHFNVTSNGDIIVHNRIDREDETLCPPQSTAECTIELSVTVTLRGDEALQQRFKVRIFVRDINDNAPQIAATVYVKVQENDASQHPTSIVVPLEKATDADTAPNGQVTYRLAVPSSKFEVVIRRQNSRCENDSICLLVKDRLDREQNPSYALLIIAEDSGSPTLSTSFTLNVTVEDVNDHAPQFVGTPYVVKVPESVGENELEQLLIRVNATDLDEPAGGIVYRIRETASKDVREMFSLDERSGELRLAAAKRLDYERVRQYTVPILAVDCGGCKTALTAYTNVNVHVTNVNDHAPEITAFSDVQLPENMRPFTSIVEIRVLDRDASANHSVVCLLDPLSTDRFAIEQRSSSSTASGSEFRYELLSRVTFDREEQPEYVVTVRCMDDDARQMTSTMDLTVRIGDRNDNVPRIEPSAIFISLPEHSDVNTPIYTFAVRDLDEAANSNVSFFLTGDSARFFQINAQTRQLFARHSFDRENSHCAPFLNFTVVVRDHGSPSLESNATVAVHVLDLNDHVPRFSKPGEHYDLLEHTDNRTLLGRLVATDNDASEENRRMRFSVVPGAFANHFEVTETGDLFAVLAFDREVLPEETVHVSVLATDLDSLNGSSIDVRVRILDRNDFFPVFVFPNSSHNRVNVTVNPAASSAAIASVFAIDRDQQSQIQYAIQSCLQGPKCLALFQIATHSGELYLTPNANGDLLIGQRFDLRIEAVDGDTSSPHRTLQDLVLTFVDDPARLKATASEHTSRQFMLIVILAAISFVLMLFLIVTVVLIKFNLLPSRRSKIATRRQADDGVQFRYALNNSLLMPTDKLNVCTATSLHESHIQAYEDVVRKEERHLGIGVDDEENRLSMDDSGKADSVIASCNCEAMETEFGHTICTIHTMSPRMPGMFRTSPNSIASHNKFMYRSGTMPHSHAEHTNVLQRFAVTPPNCPSEFVQQVEVFNKSDTARRWCAPASGPRVMCESEGANEPRTCRFQHMEHDDSPVVPLMYVSDSCGMPLNNNSIGAAADRNCNQDTERDSRSLTMLSGRRAQTPQTVEDCTERARVQCRPRNAAMEALSETRTFRPAGSAQDNVIQKNPPGFAHLPSGCDSTIFSNATNATAIHTHANATSSHSHRTDNAALQSDAATLKASNSTSSFRPHLTRPTMPNTFV